VSTTALADDDAAPPSAGPARGEATAQGPLGGGGVAEDPKLPPGTIVAQVLDADGKPLAGAEVTLGVMSNSVARGESRTRRANKADGDGAAKFDALDTGSGAAYRVMVQGGGATFSVPPFRLPAKHGLRARLYVYPVERDIERAQIAAQATLYVEVKDDRVQIQEEFRIYNLGKTAWLPQDLILPLPPEFTAFAAQQGMTDVGVDAVPKKGARLRGTFAPGEHVVELRWQLPYDGAGEVRFEVGVPPHTAAARVIAPAAKYMELEVDGFPPAKSTRDGKGQRALVTERQIGREDPAMGTIRMQIRGLPTEGPAKYFATLVAAGGVGLGLFFGTRKHRKRDLNGERARVLAELEALERAHASGDVGPKTYQRERRELVDDLARTFAAEPKPSKNKSAHA
jgi:hypothetical protein